MFMLLLICLCALTVSFNLSFTISIFIYLKGKVCSGFLPSSGSLHNVHDIQGWAALKPGACNPTFVFHLDIRDLNCLLLPPAVCLQQQTVLEGCIRSEGWTWPQVLWLRCRYPKCSLTQCARNAVSLTRILSMLWVNTWPTVLSYWDDKFVLACLDFAGCKIENPVSESLF